MVDRAGLDVVITATLRTELLALTLRSFQARLLHHFDHVRAIINIDPAGEAGVRPADVLDVVRCYCNTVVARTPAKPSFSGAVQWGWSQVSTPFFLHLEDDWLLRKPLDLDVIDRAFSDPSIGGVSLSISSRDALGNKRVHRPSLRPGFFRTACIQSMLPRFDTEADPEKQWANGVPHWSFTGYPPCAEMLIDLGKKWRQAQGLRKWEAGSPVAWTQQHAGLAGPWRQLKLKAYLQLWAAMAGPNLPR
jgi:hypothetical protein